VAADVNRRKALNELDDSRRSELLQTPAPVLTKAENGAIDVANPDIDIVGTGLGQHDPSQF
jgi:hypothetical protein